MLAERTAPSTTHVPYTTLFRSEPRGAAADRDVRGSERCGLDPGVGRCRGVGLHRRRAEEGTGKTDPRSVHFSLQRLLETAGDRKSTRLNSSHVSISYAVFCLKK